MIVMKLHKTIGVLLSEWNLVIHLPHLFDRCYFATLFLNLQRALQIQYQEGNARA
jgi:hypothetical protein